MTKIKCKKCGYVGDHLRDWKRDINFLPSFFCPKCDWKIKALDYETFASCEVERIVTGD